MTLHRIKVLLYLAAVAFIMTGCMKSMALEPRWAPLERIYESGNTPRGVTMTLDHNCYVHSIKEWEAENPPGSPQRESILLHEQVHSVRQIKSGPMWYIEYALDKKFRWHEEQLGYRVEIVYLVKNLQPVDPAYMAAIMSGSVYNGMVSYQEAESWVKSVIDSVGQ